jgi:hypothetical protein
MNGLPEAGDGQEDGDGDERIAEDKEDRASAVWRKRLKRFSLARHSFVRSFILSRIMVNLYILAPTRIPASKSHS